MKRSLILLFFLVSALTQAQHIGFPFYATEPISITTIGTLPVSGNVTTTISGTPTVNTGQQQPLTDAQLRALSLRVTQTENFKGVEDFVSVFGLPHDPGFASVYPNTYAFDGVMTPSANGGSPGLGNTNTALPQTLKAPYSRRYWVDGLMLYASEAVQMRVGVDGTNNVFQGIVGPGPVTINRSFFIHPGQGFGASLKGRLNAGSGGVVASATARLFSITSDVNYSAPIWWMPIGDSNTAGTAIQGASSVTDIYTGWVQKQLSLNDNIQTWRIEKSLEGYTTSNFETFRQQGNLDLPSQPSFITYMLGTNDPGKTISQATSLANFQAFIDWKKARYPESVLLVLGCIPNAGSTGTKAAIAAIRADQLAAITSANTGVPTTSRQYIWWLNLGDPAISWDVNDSAQNALYFSQDDGITTIHGNKLAHTAKFGPAIYNFIKTNNLHLLWKPVK